MSAENQRTAEIATVMSKVATAAYPAVGLAPWMSDYDKRTEAAIVLIKTIADGAEELDRQVWMLSHPDQVASGLPIAEMMLLDKIAVLEKGGAAKEQLESLKAELDRVRQIRAPKEEDEEEELFDLSKQSGGAYMFGFCLNQLAKNMHNYAPSIDGKRTKQAINLGKATNPGIATQPGEERKKSWAEKLHLPGTGKKGE